METRLGPVAAEHERPDSLKFAWPLIIIPEVFTTARHLALARGYLASIGWEVYTPDLRTRAVALRDNDISSLSIAGAFGGMSMALSETLEAVGRDVILIGHGLGGTLVLSAAALPQVRAAVALAPMLPGFRSPLMTGVVNWATRSFRGVLKPPRGVRLFEFLADAEPFQRETLMRSLVPADARAVLEIVHDRITVARTSDVPRLIVTGDSDPFTPLDRASEFAAAVGATLRVIRGRGHWLLAGRALERAVAEIQRFLVQRLGGDLLLLYRDEATEPEGED